jgi:hypothetical protein
MLLPTLARPGIASQTSAAELRIATAWDTCGLLSEVDSFLFKQSFTPWLLHCSVATVSQPVTGPQ